MVSDGTPNTMRMFGNLAFLPDSKKLNEEGVQFGWLVLQHKFFEICGMYLNMAKITVYAKNYRTGLWGISKQVALESVLNLSPRQVILS